MYIYFTVIGNTALHFSEFTANIIDNLPAKSKGQVNVLAICSDDFVLEYDNFNNCRVND